MGPKEAIELGKQNIILNFTEINHLLTNILKRINYHNINPVYHIKNKIITLPLLKFYYAS